MSGRRVVGRRYGNSFSRHYQSANKYGFDCLVCCHSIPGPHRRSIYAIGPCDHPICYHCAAKMRVLCEQYECPICRQEVSEIIFTEDSCKKFGDFDLSRFYFNDKYRVYFETQHCLDTFKNLLEEKCKRCRTTFNNVAELQDHLWDKHRLFTCRVCVSNLKIFSEERKYYNAGQLDTHMKIGDPDDLSYQGHPACQLCYQRYVDTEELNRHMHREHFHCHLCDTSDVVYFNDYETLNDHFRDRHYLCEEGSCKKEQFTSVFRTDIDLRAHQAESHCLSKAEAKKARTLSLNFTFNPTPRGPRSMGFISQVIAALNDDGLHSAGRGARRGDRDDRRGDRDDRRGDRDDRRGDRDDRRGDREDRRGERGDRYNGDRNPPTIPEDIWMTDDLSSFGAVGPAQSLRPEDFPSLGEPSQPSPSTTSNRSATVHKTADTNGNDESSKALKKPKHKFSTKVKETSTFEWKDDEEFPALCLPDSKNRSANRPSYQASAPSKSISLADAVKLNSKPLEKTNSTDNHFKSTKLTKSSNRNNSTNRILNDLTDYNEPSSSQDFSLAQIDFPSLPFKVNGNRKKKKALNNILASLNNPQPDPPQNYTSVGLINNLIPKENNGITSNRSYNDSRPSLEEDMKSLLLKEENFPPL